MHITLQNKNPPDGTEEIAHQLRTLADLAMDLGSVPSAHMAAHNCLLLQFQVI